jgi:hypothetical protein
VIRRAWPPRGTTSDEEATPTISVATVSRTLLASCSSHRPSARQDQVEMASTNRLASQKLGRGKGHGETKDTTSPPRGVDVLRCYGRPGCRRPVTAGSDGLPVFGSPVATLGFMRQGKGFRGLHSSIRPGSECCRLVCDQTNVGLTLKFGRERRLCTVLCSIFRRYGTCGKPATCDL